MNKQLDVNIFTLKCCILLTDTSVLYFSNVICTWRG